MVQLRSDSVPEDYYKSRVIVCSTIACLFILFLLIRLWNLQLIKGESYDDLAIENRIRLLRLPPHEA